VKIFRANSVFQAKGKLFKILKDENTLNAVNSGHTLFWRAIKSCSNILNVTSILNTAKNFMTPSVFRASASSSKILKDKIFQCSEKFQGKLYFSGHAQVVQNSEWLNWYIYSIQWLQGTLCFSGQSTSFSKVLKDENYFIAVKSFRATLFFRERKLFKNLNDKKSVTGRQGRQGRSSSTSIIMKCAKRIRDPK